jgi:GDPmannose 4,6-dehydratase
VIATGESVSLEEFVRMAFERFGLDWRQHVTINRAFFRPLDIVESRGNPAKAARVLGWTAGSRVKEVIDQLVG